MKTEGKKNNEESERVETEPEFLRKKVSEMGERNMSLGKVVNHFYKIHENSLRDALNEMIKWSDECCDPKFTDKELEAALMARTFSDAVSEEEKPLQKNRQLYDVVMGDDEIKLFHDQDKVPYAHVQIESKSRNLEVRGQEFSNYIRRKFYLATGQSASDMQLKDFVGLVSIEAEYDSEKHELHQRVVCSEGVYYYDLQNDDGEIVKITADGWSIISGSDEPFLFKNGAGKAQVRPKTGGDLKDFLELVNLKDPDEQMLFLCTLPVRLIRDIDQVLVYIHGPAGSAKTTLLKMTKDLLDPSVGGISMPVRKVEDVMVSLTHSWVFANDNISKINDELSDFFCVMATGAESARRTLYTNSDLTTFKVKNPAYLTGINVEAYKSDLMSRILLLKTSTVEEGDRKSAKEIQGKFDELLPYLLGALFDTLSKAIKIKDTLPQKTNYRMADFALWGAACAEVLGYGANKFESALQDSMKSRSYDAIYSTTAGRVLLDFMEERDEFTGTMGELLNKLKNVPTLDDNDYWENVAANPSALGKKLRELENSLTSIGIILDFGQRKSNERCITLRKIKQSEDGNLSE